MKKIFALILSVLLVFSTVTVVSAAGVDDSIIDAGDVFGYTTVYFEEAEVKADEQVTVELKIKNNTGFTNLEVTFAAEGVALVGAENGENTVATVEGNVLTVTAQEALAGEDIVIAKATFKGVSAGKQAVEMTLAALNGEEELKTGKSNGYITVTVDFVPGDFDGNGKYEVEDLSKLKKHVAKLELLEVEAHGDMNGDGVADVTDLAILKKKVAGLE